MLNIGTLFIPGADAGAVAADGSKLARVATTGVHTADAILPGSGALMKLGIEKIGFTTNGIADAAKGADGITATTRGAAGLDDMSRLSHPTTADAGKAAHATESALPDLGRTAERHGATDASRAATTDRLPGGAESPRVGSEGAATVDSAAAGAGRAPGGAAAHTTADGTETASRSGGQGARGAAAEPETSAAHSHSTRTESTTDGPVRQPANEPAPAHHGAKEPDPARTGSHEAGGERAASSEAAPARTGSHSEAGPTASGRTSSHGVGDEPASARTGSHEAGGESSSARATSHEAGGEHTAGTGNEPRPHAGADHDSARAADHAAQGSRPGSAGDHPGHTSDAGPHPDETHTTGSQRGRSDAEGAPGPARHVGEPGSSPGASSTHEPPGPDRSDATGAAGARRPTIPARDAPDPHFGPQDIDDALGRAPRDAEGRPLDHRTNEPLLLERSDGQRGWHMRWDDAASEWVAENPGQGMTRGLPPYGESGSFGYDDVGERLPYANHRPAHATDQDVAVWEQAKNEYGEVWVRDAGGNPYEVDWTPGAPRDGVWDMGHRADAKYSDLRQQYLNHEISLEEFLEEYRDPRNYRVEDPVRNQSHVDE